MKKNCQGYYELVSHECREISAEEDLAANCWKEQSSKEEKENKMTIIFLYDLYPNILTKFIIIVEFKILKKVNM